jgi:hypothetical protein
VNPGFYQVASFLIDTTTTLHFADSMPKFRGSFENIEHICENSGFHGGEYEDVCLLGRCAI